MIVATYSLTIENSLIKSILASSEDFASIVQHLFDEAIAERYKFLKNLLALSGPDAESEESLHHEHDQLQSISKFAKETMGIANLGAAHILSFDLAVDEDDDAESVLDFIEDCFLMIVRQYLKAIVLGIRYSGDRRKHGLDLISEFVDALSASAGHGKISFNKNKQQEK